MRKKSLLSMILATSLLICSQNSIICKASDNTNIGSEEVLTVEEATTELATSTDSDLNLDIPDINGTGSTLDINNVDTQTDVSLNMTLGDFKKVAEEESSLYGSLSYDAAFEMMKNSLDKGEPISLTDAFIATGGLTVPDNFMYDLSESGLTGTLDKTQLNFEYANLINKMNADSAAMSLNLSSQSIGAVNLFESQYGDLASELQLESATLPEGFTMAEISANNNNIVNNLYSQAYSESDFASIRSSIDVSGIFNKASQGVDTYSLASADDLQNTLDGLVSDYRQNAEDYKNNSQDIINSKIINAANNQVETRNYVDSYYVDANGVLVTPDIQVDNSGNTISQLGVDDVYYNNMHNVADNNVASVWFNNWHDGDLVEYVDGDSNALTQAACGYPVEIWLDTMTGQDLVDEGEDLNWMEYLASGQAGEDIYDYFHPTYEGNIISSMNNLVQDINNLK